MLSLDDVKRHDRFWSEKKWRTKTLNGLQHSFIVIRLFSHSFEATGVASYVCKVPFRLLMPRFFISRPTLFQHQLVIVSTIVDVHYLITRLRLYFCVDSFMFQQKR